MNREEIKNLSSLSKLSLSGEEQEALTADLQSLLALCDVLSELSSDAPSEEARSETREDTPRPCLTREEAFCACSAWRASESAREALWR